MEGAANLWWVPLANIFGRRPITLIALLMFMLCSVWCGKATTFNSLLVGRIFQGIGLAPADCVAPDVVGEVFFVHQRGRAMVRYRPKTTDEAH
jgi:MFS family permease